MFAADQEQDQDNLRVLRTFVGALNGFMGGNDQSYAGQDASASNPPRQFVVLGPQGASLEGTQTQVATASGGLVLSPALLLVGGLVLVVGVALAMGKRG